MDHVTKTIEKPADDFKATSQQAQLEPQLEQAHFQSERLVDVRA